LIETVVVFILATLSGIFGGLMPGVGGLVVLVTAFPFLMSLDPVNVVLFYVVLISIDQYFNNTSAILLGLPGYATAVPSVIEGHTMFRRGEGDKAIMFSAIASWFCSAFAVMFVLACIPILFLFYEMWNSTVQAVIFAIAFISIVLFSPNRIWINTILFLLGLFLGWIGYDESLGIHNLTLNWTPLYGGIPTLCVIVALFIIPNFINSYLKDSSAISWPLLTIKGYWHSLLEIKNHYLTLLRSAFIGCIGGFVPGLAYSASTLFAYYGEKIFRGKAYRKGDVKCLIASEGSNNAGAFTQLVPLLFLGIPITAAEALIYNILESKGVSLTVAWFQDTFSLVVICFMLSSTIGLLVAGKYINIFRFLDGFSVEKLYLFIVSSLIFMIWWLGNVTMNGEDHLLIFAMLVPFGLLMRKLDTSPLIFGFLLHDTIFWVSKRIAIMYF
jgi:putative tricarboxylic transport membrane protein